MQYLHIIRNTYTITAATSIHCPMVRFCLSYLNNKLFSVNLCNFSCKWCLASAYLGMILIKPPNEGTTYIVKKIARFNKHQQQTKINFEINNIKNKEKNYRIE